MLIVTEHHDICIIGRVEHQPLYLHLCNHNKPAPIPQLNCEEVLIIVADGSRMNQCSTSEIGLSTKPARSLKKFIERSGDQRSGRCGKVSWFVLFIWLASFNHTNETNHTNQITIFLGRWAIVLIEFSCIRLFPEFEEGLHLLLHEFPAALFA